MDETAAVWRAGAYLRGDDAGAQVQFAARRLGADQVADRLAYRGGLPWTARWVLPAEETPHRTLIALRGPITALWTDRSGEAGALAASGHYAVCDATGRVVAEGQSRATTGLTVDGRHLLAAADAAAAAAADAGAGADGPALRLWEAAAGSPVELDRVGVQLERLHVAAGRLLVGTEPVTYDHNDIGSGGGIRAWTVRGDPPRLHETTPERGAATTHPFTGGRDGVLRRWDGPAAEAPVPLATPLAAASTTLDDGRRVAVVAHDNGRVGVWDLDEGAPPEPVPHEFTALAAVACVRGLAAVGCLDGTLHIVDLGVRAGAVVRTIVMPVAGPLPGTGSLRWPGVPEPPPGPEPVRGVAAALRPDGSPVVVTVGDLGLLRWWCPRTGRELAAVPLHRGGRGIACRDGRIVVATTGFSPQVYDLRTAAAALGTLPAAGPTGPVAVDLLDGVVVALDGHGTLHRLPLDGTAPPEPSPGHYGEARTVACGHHPDGRAIAVTGGWDGTVRVWDLRTGRERHRIPVERPVHAVALTADGTIVVGWQGGLGVFQLHGRARP